MTSRGLAAVLCLVSFAAFFAALFCIPFDAWKWGIALAGSGVLTFLIGMAAHEAAKRDEGDKQ